MSEQNKANETIARAQSQVLQGTESFVKYGKAVAKTLEDPLTGALPLTAAWLQGICLLLGSTRRLKFK